MNAGRELLRKQALRVARGMPGDVPSPCLSVCRMDPASELCHGCLRTLDEVAAWGRMGDEEKRAVWAEIGKRIERKDAP